MLIQAYLVGIGCEQSQNVGIGGVGTGLNSLGVFLQNLVICFLFPFLLIDRLGFSEVLDTILEIFLDDLNVISRLLYIL